MALWRDNTPPVTDCPDCGGTGRKTVQKLDVARGTDGRSAGRTVDVEIECPQCGGIGQLLSGPPA